MTNRCKKFKEAIEKQCIDMNHDETYDIEGNKYDLLRDYTYTKYMLITYCPFCGEKL